MLTYAEGGVARALQRGIQSGILVEPEYGGNHLGEACGLVPTFSHLHQVLTLLALIVDLFLFTGRDDLGETSSRYAVY
jgi:hypothetical protein